MNRQSEYPFCFVKRFFLAAIVGLALVLALPSGILAAAGNPNANPGEMSPAVYEVIFEPDVVITLSDGIKL